MLGPITLAKLLISILFPGTCIFIGMEVNEIQSILWGSNHTFDAGIRTTM